MYKVGDKVVITKDFTFNANIRKGDIGIIVGICEIDGVCTIKIVEPVRSEIFWVIRPDSLKKYKEPFTINTEQDYYSWLAARLK